MAEGIVSFLAGEISILLKKEKKLLGEVRGDVQFIHHELQQMRAFLGAAEVIEEPANPQLSAWVKEVREIAFDIEDTIDEYRFYLRNDRRGAIRICMISRFFKNLKCRHEIASHIQGLKYRIINASQRPQRYQLNIQKQSQCFVGTSSIISQQRSNALLLEEDELVGIDDPKRQLCDWLIGGDFMLKVIAVAGMGGLGKTTLVKTVYDDFVVQKHFKIHAWVTVSQSFKIEELLKNIIHQIFKESKQQISEGMDKMESHDLKKFVKNFLLNDRYLLVLDDLWDEGAWDAIKHALPKRNYGSRVILTTRNNEVAKVSCSYTTGKVYRLKPLSSELSWKLFCTKAFHKDQCPQHLNDIAKSIVEKCHGLPLAIVAISGVLATKSSADEWEMVCRNLSDELQTDKLIRVKKILLLSYNYLPFNLKACILHISMFPEDYNIHLLQLVALWIAEGFVEETDGKTLEEVGFIYLKELVDRNLVQMNGFLNIECHIHDLLREVILSKAKDQNFAAVINEKTTNWPENARRVSLHNTLRNIPYSNQLCGLRTLLVFGVDDIPFSFLTSGLRLLKVLDLSNSNLELFPNEITKLYHLKYLNLTRTNIRVIPSSIERLQNMQYLDFSETNVTCLPRTILKLQQLRFLHVCSSQSKFQGFVGFPGIGCLSCLNLLGRIEMNVKGCIDVIQELGKLTQLRHVGILKLKKEYGPALCSSLNKLKMLKSLFVSSIDEEEILDLQFISSPPKFLKRLFLNGRLSKLPCWIQSLHCLYMLELQASHLHDRMLKAIQDLPNLIHLKLENALQGDKLCFKEGGFQKLKVLELVKSKALHRVEIEKGSMPCLKELNIRCCPSMEYVPFGIEHLSKLRKVNLFKVSNQLTNKINPGGEDYWRLEQYVPQVNVYL